MIFKQYDVVRVTGIRVPAQVLVDTFDRRPPAIGDVATLIEVYDNPPGYELECSDAGGITQWLTAFAPDEIDLELVV